MILKFKGWGQFARTALHHKNPQRRPKDLSMSNPKVLQRWARGESGRWKMSLEAIVSILHVGGSGLWSLCCRLGGDGNALQHPETILDKTSSDRPERRSALVAHKLLRLNIDITALSQVRFPGKGSLNEHGAGYTLYWSGRQPEQRRISGVGIMIKDSLASKLETLPTGHSDRIMSMRLPLDKNQHLTLFSVYAPTLQAEPVEKDSFYSELGRLLTNTHAGDKVLILGDFNARVGRDSDA
ncbi:craniofacial development protein 2 [Elysia marginata]|uniref:Craniofacial development protein 2 n=1 Tax=Elysia marginata TaxID=1093978 RepID=A0AAV4JM79_9GAST|nr:craniofacial development protein 2 [Elysia marginata]